MGNNKKAKSTKKDDFMTPDLQADLDFVLNEINNVPNFKKPYNMLKKLKSTILTQEFKNKVFELVLNTAAEYGYAMEMNYSRNDILSGEVAIGESISLVLLNRNSEIFFLVNFHVTTNSVSWQAAGNGVEDTEFQLFVQELKERIILIN